MSACSSASSTTPTVMMAGQLMLPYVLMYLCALEPEVPVLASLECPCDEQHWESSA